MTVVVGNIDDNRRFISSHDLPLEPGFALRYAVALAQTPRETLGYACVGLLVAFNSANHFCNFFPFMSSRRGGMNGFMKGSSHSGKSDVVVIFTHPTPCLVPKNLAKLPLCAIV